MTRKASTWSVLFGAAAVLLVCAAEVRAEWEAEVKLSTSSGGATMNENMGRCLIASGSTVHAVWSESHAICYRHSLDRGATWEAAQRLTPQGQSDGWPLLALSGESVHLVFLRNPNSPTSESYYRRSRDGGKTWEDEVLLGKSKFWPGVAASGSNVYAALNTQEGDGNTEVYLRRSSDNGKTWLPSQRISNAPGRSEDPCLAACGRHVYLAWNDNRDAIAQKHMAVYYAHSSDDGATWGPETALTRAPQDTYMPTIFPTERDAEVLYADRTGGAFSIQRLHSSDAGATWPAPEALPQSVKPKFYPSVARDGANVHVVWCEDGKLAYLHSADGGAHWAPQEILAETALQCSFVAVEGEAVQVAWADRRGIFYRRNQKGNSLPKETGAK